MAMYARMRDGNEPEIVKALEAIGASVTKLNGAGVPDLLVGYRGATFLLEVKRPEGAKGGRKARSGGASRVGRGGDGELTESQVKWWKGWRGAPAIVVRTPEEAIAAIGAPPRENPTRLDASGTGTLPLDALSSRHILDDEVL